MKIRTKISLHLGLFILVVTSAIFVLNYLVVRRSLTQKAHLELAKIQQNMHRAAETLLDTAIKNYLRGITENNIDYIKAQYSAFKHGAITEERAKELVQEHFNRQPIGTSGYLVAVEENNSKLYLDLHPFLPRQECTETEGCQAWVATRNGYTEYNWKNPADNTFKKKAAYVQEFSAWNWIVGASSYRNEFVNLVHIEDLRALLSPIIINQTGYFFVFDEDYTILIHPEVQGTEGRDLVNSKGESIIELLLQSKDGYLTYHWKNPSETKERLKYAFVQKLDDYGWYLVASGYLSEVYAPITHLKHLTTVIGLLLGVILLVIIFRLSGQITRPLQLLEKGINHFYDKQSPFIWNHQQVKEINMLGNAFSRMTTELARSMEELQEKNVELEMSKRDKEVGRLYLDSIINSMPSTIIGVDPNMNVTQWNNRAEQTTGISKENVKGNLLFDVFPQLKQHNDKLQQGIEENQILTIPHCETSEGSSDFHHSEIIVYPLITPGNKGAVIRIDEVTDRIEIEQRLRQSQKMDAIGQLAGGIAHDFNNMLSGILGAADLLRLKVAPENQPLVKIITESSERAGELIQKLLAFSRKEKIPFAPVNMNNILNDTIDILRRTLDKRITVECRPDAGLKTVLGDWSQLQNACLNIGINGGHAMPNGGNLLFESCSVALDTNYCEASTFDISPGEYVQIRIKDTGSGIAKEHLKHIFEPFFTTKHQTKGTGLGLASVYGIVQQHHGAISVVSEQGKGTAFIILLPVSNEKEAPPQRIEKSLKGDGCILLIDDEPVVRMTVRKMLESIGYSVLEAEDGQEGIKIYQNKRDLIDMVLLDMLMPVMDGTECFYLLKKINPDVQVIISSGFTRDADLKSMKEAGLTDLIRKPYNVQKLGETIDHSMRSIPGRNAS